MLLGTSYESTNNSNSNGLTPGPSLASVLYQAFIPPDYVSGPPEDPTCVSSVYAGDNRVLNPTGGSYRAFQQIVVGIGGLNVSLAPAQNTGFTYQFSSLVPQNGVIPSSAFNYGYLGKCSSKGIHAFGQASKAQMVVPPVSYPSATQTVTHFTGKVTNPIPLIAIPIDWDISVNLTEANSTTMVVSGYYDVDCYPAHELSVANFDVFSFVPTDNSLSNITFCLLGVNAKQGNYSTNVPM